MSLTADFERRRYGRPQPEALPETDSAPAGTAARQSSSGSSGRKQSTALRIAAVQQSLRANARRSWRLRADWLPLSILGRLGRMLAAPFRAVGNLARWTAKAAAHSWMRARDGLRRLREG
jgi:hypothetical protein